MGVTYLVIGGIRHPPKGTLCTFPLAPPRLSALYRAQVKAVMSVQTEFFCLLDGGEDELLDGFELSVARRVEAMQRTGAAVGYADEVVNGQTVVSGEFSPAAQRANPQMIHHGVVCRTSAAQAIDWPAGCYWFEAVCYGKLAQQGYVYDPQPVYEWKPSPNGARLWVDVQRGVVNSLRWLQGLPGIHFPNDFKG